MPFSVEETTLKTITTNFNVSQNMRLGKELGYSQDYNSKVINVPVCVEFGPFEK